MSDENYPKIGINVNGTVEQAGGSFFWRIGTHIEGPDNTIDRESCHFPTREMATKNMLARFEEVVKEQLQEIFE